MNKLWILILAVSLTMVSCKENKEGEIDQQDGATIVALNETPQQQNNIEITPLSHATFVINWDDQIIYVDPVGGAAAFIEMPDANLVLITDIHYDHLNEETLAAVKGESDVVVPQAVADKITGFEPNYILNNGDTKNIAGIEITAVPMYNLTDERLKFHSKGRGNGYVLEKNNYRIYISGDTEDIPEMRSLKNIDKAFVCMNLPYTMDVQQAVSAVLEFKPKEVVPYHYRGTEGFQDVEAFQKHVNEADKNIKVTLLDWYPELKG
jgi:L-ascorbate metabolism protein UlaG (beta-lactamase superfamily)